MRSIKVIGVIAVLALAGVACSSSSDNGGAVQTPISSSSSPAACQTPSAEPQVTVNATDALKFEPASIKVKPCQLVVWKVTGSVAHTVTGLSGATFDSGTLNQNQTFTQGFPTAGTIKYYCKIHGQSMSGTITVSS